MTATRTTLWQLYWGIVSLLVLVVFGCHMQGNIYNYSWKSSATDRSDIQRYVTFLSGNGLGHLVRWSTPIPNEADMDWLFRNVDAASEKGGEKHAAAVISSGEKKETEKDHAADEVFRYRKKWSWFLFYVILWWAVIPRILFLLFNNFRRNRRFRERFGVDRTNSYFAKILDRAEAKGRPATASRRVEDQNADDGRFRPDDGRKVAESPGMAVKKEGTESLADSREDAESALGEVSDLPATAPPVDLTLALGYDAEMSPEQWRSILGDDDRLRLLGNITASRESFREFPAKLVEIAPRIRRVVLLVDMVTSPAAQTRVFLRDELFARLPKAERTVLLSGGERMRRKFRSNPTAVAGWLAEWEEAFRQMAVTLGSPIKTISYYDHQLDAADARRRLAENFGTVSPGENRVAPNRRFDRAKETILGEASAIFDGKIAPAEVPDSEFFEAFRVRQADAFTRLAGIYRSDDSVENVSASGFFHRVFSRKENGEKTKTDADTSESTAKSEEVPGGSPIDSAGDTAKKLFSLDQLTRIKGIPSKLVERLQEANLRPEEWLGQVAPAIDSVNKVTEFCRKLSPRCAIAFGAVGATFPLLAVAAPVVGGGMTVGAILAALPSLVPMGIAGGVTGAAVGSLAPISFSALKSKIYRLISAEEKPETIEKSDEIAVSADRIAVAVGVAVRSLTTWAVVFHLQGLDEDEIADELPRVLTPLEESPLDSPGEIKRTLDAVGALFPQSAESTEKVEKAE